MNMILNPQYGQSYGNLEVVLDDGSVKTPIPLFVVECFLWYMVVVHILIDVLLQMGKL
jgi:hypothetical protein